MYLFHANQRATQVCTNIAQFHRQVLARVVFFCIHLFIYSCLGRDGGETGIGPPIPQYVSRIFTRVLETLKIHLSLLWCVGS